MDYKNDTHKLTSATGTFTPEGVAAIKARRTDKFDKQGNPISMGEWAGLLNNKEYGRIYRWEICGITFSTVWIGLDHSFDPDTPPLIFESMAFENKKGKPDPSGIYQDRYTTLNQAKLGHFKMIIKVIWAKFIAFLRAAGNRFTKAIKR